MISTDLQQLITNFKNKVISKQKFFNSCKLYYNNEIKDETKFLDEYQPDFNERIYYVFNNIHEIVKCKYCGKKAIWTGRLNEGYKEICDSKECRSKQLVDTHKGKTIISNNRDNDFISIQNNITEVNDDVIKDLLKYDKFLDLVTNENILKYLDNRFSDSSSRLETLQRIRFGIEEKPKCPTCGKPVVWVGKKSKLYTTYCSTFCSNNNQSVKDKKKNTQLENWGSECCYNSEKYKNEMVKKYGVEYNSQRQDVKEKRLTTLNKNKINVPFGFLREHSSKADGYDPVTNINRTGLDEYLKVIFPNINDWIHDKVFGEFNGVKYNIRPDYRSESLKLIIEFDGLQHYTNPKQIEKDTANTKIYESCGYKVVRIPYFIQLSNKAVKTLFGIDVKTELFNEDYPSIGGKDVKGNPSYLCIEGIKRMAKEFKKFPTQYIVNIKSLEKIGDEKLSGIKYLKDEYNKL